MHLAWTVGVSETGLKLMQTTGISQSLMTNPVGRYGKFQGWHCVGEVLHALEPLGSPSNKI